MSIALREAEIESAPESLVEHFRRVRARSEALLDGLAPEDTVVQTMPDVSPTKWHLAHTTWFFEEFVLAAFKPGYERVHASYDYLFNSYYNLVGPMYPRPRRGLISRPTLLEVRQYRERVSEAVAALLGECAGDAALAERIVLGCNHEQQHQELIAMDIKHVLAQNPLAPAWRALPPVDLSAPPPLGWHEFAGGLVEVGHAGDGFVFDNEGPRHKAWLEPYAMADRPVTNKEYGEFIADGGYRHPELWLSDGWACVKAEGWQRPLYWHADGEREFTVAGWRDIEPAAPVCHLSYFEADAYASWAALRLPIEAEWENAAAGRGVDGNLADDGRLHPAPVARAPLAALWGDVWEWTASAYLAYPGYRAPGGAIGEYNGKFMSGQMVLRGGCCATPADHIRASYRNFFYPHQRWQFAGLRLARDI
jgi:ergothioneine biosynthesis protein EgtB